MFGIILNSHLSFIKLLLQEMLLCIRFHFNTIVRMFMHTATYYMTMYGYIYMTFGLFNADACTK